MFLPTLGRVFLHLPLFHPSGDVGNVVESIGEHPFGGAGAAHPHGAVDEVFRVLGEIGRDLRPSAEREELRALDVGHEVFVLLADIEKDALESLGEYFTKFER